MHSKQHEFVKIFGLLLYFMVLKTFNPLSWQEASFVFKKKNYSASYLPIEERKIFSNGSFADMWDVNVQHVEHRK